MKLKFVFLASVFTLAATAAPALAWDDSFRCGVRLVNVGDSEETVLDKCGRPTKSIRKTAKWRTIITTVDQWTYDLGPNQFTRILTFDATADRLTTIVLGGYGK
jgi:hypothetical protein